MQPLQNVNIWIENPKYIDHYISLGFDFKKVCTVKSTQHGNEWYYVDIDEDILYSKHRSWVYVLTRFNRILKIGETGNPLGIRSSKGGSQPLRGSHNRLGRYRRGDKSDQTVRESYRNETQDEYGLEFYAVKCQEIDISMPKLSKKPIKAQIHKQLEKFLLDYYKEKVGVYPPSNTGRY